MEGIPMLILSVGGIILMLFFVTYSSQRHNLNSIKDKTVGNGQHGTARWATQQEIKRIYNHVPFTPELWRQAAREGKQPTANGKSLPQGIVLGSKGNRTTTALVDSDDIHVMMIGASGVGKTAYFLYPNLEYACASGMSFLALDTKGDLARNYGAIARDIYGYRISVVDLREPTRSDGNNLLTLINRYMDKHREDPKDIGAKAKAEKKNLFIDFYANWCGPCKVMAAQVFTIPPVGDYFNEHFINCKLDCDAAANKEVVKRYKVESLPTLMFLDSKGEVLRTLVGAVTPDVLMLEAQIATGEELPFEKLYEKSRKEKKNTELQQKLLIRAPHFIGTQNGYNQEKWKVRIDALFPEYLKTKKLENMINPTDFTILSLYHPEMEKQDGIFDFVVKNYDRYGEAVDKETVQNYLIGLYNTYILRLCSTGKTDYRQALGRIGGDLRAIYAGMPFGDLTAVEAVTLLADSYFNLFRHNLPLFFENMNKYFAGAGKALSINDYTQPIEDLYGIYQGNPPDNARPMLIQWLDRALTFDMTAQLRARLLMLLAENQQKTGDSAKAKQSLNQAFIVCAGIPEEAVKVQLQNMIREKLNDL